MLRKIKDLSIQTLLSVPCLRHWITWELRKRYFLDLDVIVPIGDSLACPIPHDQAWFSFHEIFIMGEYAPAFRRIPLPQRWLDIGCYSGFFSAYVMMLREREAMDRNTQALLIDGDSRSGPAVGKFIKINNLENGQVTFKRALIAEGSGNKQFVERPYMASSLAAAKAGKEVGPSQTVSVITADEIMNMFPPPYDLIKLDIEGAERAFLSAYQAVLLKSKHLLLEWHNYGDHGITPREARELLSNIGFSELLEVTPTREVIAEDTKVESGVLLFVNDLKLGQFSGAAT